MKDFTFARILFAFALSLAVAGNAVARQKSISLTLLGTYASGIYDEGGAEIVAHDPKTHRLFVVNAKAATVDVLSIKKPSRPEKIGQINVPPFGAVANSVAVHESLIAVAVESAEKTSPGMVVFFDGQLRLLNAVQVGALPDMLTFSPNGRWLLVANEGEPSDDYTIDPEGSVSVIDMRRGAAGLRLSDVRTAGFVAFNAPNGVKLDAGIRIFGPGATVAQDIEPEYLTVSNDSRTAWVTCQENNALAIIDIASAVVTRLVGLGFKDHGAVDASTKIYEFHSSALPSIGATAAGQQLFLGGFSGLHFEGVDRRVAVTSSSLTPTGAPNAEPTDKGRPFLLPQFAPEIIRFELDRKTSTLTVTERIPLQREPGMPLTGLPNTAIVGSANTPYNDEVPVDLLGKPLPLDPLGGDFEGLVTDPKSTFWMADEYRPAIYHFDANGVLKKRYVPIGTALAAGKPAGTFGEEVLPAVLAQRRQNRGFEAIAYDNGKIYAFVQSPLRNPVSLTNSTLNGLRNIRVVEFDPDTPDTLKTKQYIYVMDNPDPLEETDTRADKIGDAVSFGNGEFLVLERDDDSVPDDVPAKIEKKIYRFNLDGATDVSDLTGTVGTTGKTIDELTVDEMLANNIQPIEKTLHVDLNAVGYNEVQKVEGLTWIDPRTLAVINDNDFGVASIIVNKDGTFILNYTPD